MWTPSQCCSVSPCAVRPEPVEGLPFDWLRANGIFLKRTVLDAEQVSIIGVFYGGQDYETILQDDSEDGPEH